MALLARVFPLAWLGLAVRPSGEHFAGERVHSRASLVAGFTNAAESFVEQLSAEELRQAKAIPHVSILEEYGLPLAQQFRFFALLEAAKVDAFNVPTGSAALELEATDDEAAANFTFESRMTQAFKGASQPADLTASYLDELGFISAVVNVSEFSQYRVAFEGVKRILGRLEVVERGKPVPLPGSWLDVLLSDVDESANDTMAPMTSVDTRCGKGSRAACKAGRRKHNATQDPMNPAVLRDKILDVMLDIGDVEFVMKKAAAVDWANVKKKRNLFQRVAQAIVSAGRAAKNLIRKAFNAFMSKMSSASEECIQSQQQEELRAVSSLPNASNVQSEDAVARGLQQADAVLADFEAKGRKTESQLNTEVATLKATAQELEHGAASGQGSGENLHKLEAQSVKLEGQTCKAKTGREAGSLRTLVKDTKKEGSMVPQLGIRGIGGWASILAGGLEEIVDFRTREIGWFSAGGATAGTSMVGLTLGGYVGVGWKGRRDLNQSLGDYGPGPSLFTAIGASVPMPIPVVSWGVGVTFEVDADERLGGPPYVPQAREPGVYMYIGWSVSLGLYGGPVGLDVGSMYSTPIHIDCFETTSDLMKAIPKVTCKDCPNSKMRAAITGLRTVQHLATFPIISDLFFLYLAYKNNKGEIRQGFEGACSTSPNQVFQYATTIVQEAFTGLARVEKHFQTLETEILAAVQNNGEVPNSKEFLKLHEDLAALRVASVRYGSLDDFSPGPQGALQASNSIASAAWMSLEDFEILYYKKLKPMKYQLCPSLGLASGECIFENIFDTLKMNSRNNPFGFCALISNSHNCVLAHTTCIAILGRSKNGKAVKVSRGKVAMLGQCQCKSGYFYKYTAAGGHFCAAVPSGADLVHQVIQDIRRWIDVRKLALGSYVRDLLVAAGHSS